MQGGANRRRMLVGANAQPAGSFCKQFSPETADAADGGRLLDGDFGVSYDSVVLTRRVAHASVKRMRIL